MITKELLSAILNDSVLSINYISPENYLYYQSCPKDKNINIYELANKCKIWADSLGYEIESSVQANIGYATLSYEDMTKCTPSAATEPEAIFQACQYILENQDRKRYELKMFIPNTNVLVFNAFIMKNGEYDIIPVEGFDIDLVYKDLFLRIIKGKLSIKYFDKSKLKDNQMPIPEYFTISGEDAIANIEKAKNADMNLLGVQVSFNFKH